MSKRKTHNEYVSELTIKNPNIEVLGLYSGNKTNILHRCKVDGYEWMASPSNILSGKGCPVCSKTKKKTHEEYVEEVSRTNPSIEVLGKYVNLRTKILHKCKLDGYEWHTTPSSILAGYGCPRCSNHEVYGHDEYVKRVVKINPNIEVVDRYIDSQTKILHRCKIDNYEWYARPSKILVGKGCPKCGGSMLKSHEQYVDELKLKSPSIIVLGQYVNCKTKIMHKCLVHNYEWETAPINVLTGRMCPMCRGEKIRNKLVKSCEQYINEVSAVNKNIVVLGEYVNAKTKIKHKCLVCGLEWNAYPDDIVHGGGCPHCNKSVGEKMVSIWLDNNNIQYEIQKTFNDCRDKKPLPFDFYLPKYNVLIEYNGIQHYEPVEYFGGANKFESQIQRDNIKKEYCRKNNISLFVIPYFKDINEELIKLYEIIKTNNVEKEVIA